MAMQYSPAFQQTLGNMRGQDTPVDYSSYGSAIGGLREKQQGAQGYINPNLSVMGSEAAGYQIKAGQLENARSIDPFSFYRGSAADMLAGYADPKADPSNIYRSRLQQMLMGEFSPNDPSYQWRFDQGQQAVERSLAARGLLDSGNAAIELQQYGQGAASQEYQAQFARILGAMGGVENQYNSQIGRLMELAGIGNAGVLNQNLALGSGIAEKANEDMGIAAAINQRPAYNAAFGGGAV
jgi:hypothetical protein